MSLWFLLNLIVLIILLTKIVANDQLLHIIIGGIGYILFLFNWTRHAVFSTLRSNLDRRKKIKFANLSKKVYPFHRWIGTTALMMILLHAILVVQRYGFHLNHSKMLTGICALIILICLVITGWMRLFRPSFKKRIAHLWLGLTLFFVALSHLLI